MYCNFRPSDPFYLRWLWQYVLSPSVHSCNMSPSHSLQPLHSPGESVTDTFAITVMGGSLSAGVHQVPSLPGPNQTPTWALLSRLPSLQPCQGLGPRPSLAYHDAFEEYSSLPCRLSMCISWSRLWIRLRFRSFRAGVNVPSLCIVLGTNIYIYNLHGLLAKMLLTSFLLSINILFFPLVVVNI